MGSVIDTTYLFLFRYDFRGYGFTPTALFIFLAKAVFLPPYYLGLVQVFH